MTVSTRLAPLFAALLSGVACGDDAPPAAEATTATGATTGSDDTAAHASASTHAGSGADSSGGPAGTGTGSTTTGPAGGCWDDLATGEVQVLYDGFLMGSEGLAFGQDGNLFATTSEMGVGTVWRLDGAGQATAFADVPYALGLAATAGGGFIVASIGVNSAPDGAVYTVDADGTATLLAEGIDSPNFVAIAPDGSALVSDDFDTRVFRVGLDGEVSVAIQDVPSPNGMAYSPDGTALYVASTFTPDGQLTRYDVDGDGFPVEASGVEIFQLGPSSTLDGIAVDEAGAVYVAANLKGEIWRVDGTATSVVAGERVVEGLSSPASLAFGRGNDFDPCSIYATELFGRNVVRVAVGIAGAPLFE